MCVDMCGWCVDVCGWHVGCVWMVCKQKKETCFEFNTSHKVAASCSGLVSFTKHITVNFMSIVNSLKMRQPNYMKSSRIKF